MSKRRFDDRVAMHARALLLGERIDVRALDRGEVLASGPPVVAAGSRGCAVLFRHGAAVLFDLDPPEEVAFLRNMAPLVTNPLDGPETEEADILIDADQRERIDPSGKLVLREASLERIQVVAEILAKSAVLTHYESRVATVFDGVEPLAVALKQGRQRTMRGRQLLRQIGEVLEIQARTVGRVEVAEKPELTWDEPELDRLYERLAAEYELHDRDRALGRKLELIGRTAETLLDLLDTRRSLRLEWYIVILIAVEIVLILYDIFWAR